MTVERFTRAFTWFSKAERAESRIERFIALWVTVMFLTHYKKQGHTGRRLAIFAEAVGTPGLCERLKQAYNARNLLLHKGIDSVTDEQLEALRADVAAMMRFSFLLLRLGD